MDRSKIIGFALGPIITAILGLASLPILAWYFSTEDIGRISMLQVVISFTVILFSLGLDQSYVREYHQVKNKAVLLIEGFSVVYEAMLTGESVPVLKVSIN